MRDIKDISIYLDKISKNTIKDLIEVQRSVAENICEDAKTFAPEGKTGAYKESIRVNNTIVKDNKISTTISTNIIVKAKYNGNEYNLGYLLENGTLEHAIPNAFGLGFTYGYIDRYGVKHKGTMDKDWHPGFGPIPHFIPALLFNKENYNREIARVIEKEFKA